jgi:hypothetical protein
MTKKRKNTKNNEEKAQNFGVGEFRGTDFRVFASPLFQLLSVSFEGVVKIRQAPFVCDY